MQMLFDNEKYVVVHQALNPESRWSPDHCFEIIDKATNKEVFLRGSWADAFQRVIQTWQLDTPLEEEVESTLAGYCLLAQIPLTIH